MRGTSFRIAFERDEDRALGEVLDGELGVSASGVSLALPSGFGNVTRTGEPPGEPVELLPAPDLAALTQRLPAQPIAFDWPDLEGASRYRGQVFEGQGFDRLLLEQVVDQSEIEWQALPLGDYVFRARAIDVNGLEGANANHAFSIEALLLAPLLLGPDDGAATPGRWLAMSWDVPAEAGGFHLQIAQDREFSDPVIDETTLQDWRYTPDTTLDPGVYFWRVATIDRNGTRGPFGEVRQFRIQAVPEIPLVESVKSDEPTPRLSWQAGTGAAAYRLEISRDPEFSDLVKIERLESPEYSMPDLSPGVYYLRLQSLSEEDVAGAFSEPVRVKVKGWPIWSIGLALLLAAIAIIAFALRRR